MSDSDHTILIGIDGGGSGCRVAVGNLASGILGRADGGRANAASDFEGAIANIISTAELAAQQAGLRVHDLKHAVAHAGLAGVMTENDGNRIAGALPYSSTSVTDDRATTAEGALGGRDGFVLSIGTGAILASRKDDVVQFVGGRGFYLSDQGAGGWLGQAALRHVLLCEDGIERHSTLTRNLMSKFDDDPVALVRFSVTAKPGDYAAFAPDVVDAARNGDALGQDLMQSGASYLLRGLGALGFKSGDPLCLTGGLGPHYAPYFPADPLRGQQKAAGNALDGAFQLAGFHAAQLKGAVL